MVTIDMSELDRMDNTILNLRNQIDIIRQENVKLKSEISFLKDSGENILVIVKDKDKPDIHEYKSDEKTVILDLVTENSNIRNRYDELSRNIDNVENQKQLILMKYKEMESIYKNQILKLENYIEYLENRSIFSRLKNDKKNLINSVYISYDEPLLIDSGPVKVVYSEEDIKKLEESVKSIKKPRGWQFMNEFVDIEGNVYNKGKIQPHLKGTKKAT